MISTVTLTAPTSGPTANLVVVGPTNGSTAGAGFGERSTNTSLSGPFYVPTAPLSLSGAASVGNGSGQCLMFIGSQVSLVGGSMLASSCSGLGGTASGSAVVLVG